MNTNIVVITGNLVRDIDLKFAPAKGTAIANFTIAVNGMNEDDVSFVKVTAFTNTAEAMANYTSKGSKVAVTGYLKQNTWKNKDGENRSELKVNATRVEFLSQKNSLNDEKGIPGEDPEDEFSNFDEDDVFEPTDDDDIPF